MPNCIDGEQFFIAKYFGLRAVKIDHVTFPVIIPFYVAIDDAHSNYFGVEGEENPISDRYVGRFSLAIKAIFSTFCDTPPCEPCSYSVKSRTEFLTELLFVQVEDIVAQSPLKKWRKKIGQISLLNDVLMPTSARKAAAD